MKTPQAPHAVVMVRPHRFQPNPQTRADNRFQQSGPPCAALGPQARREFDAAVDRLREAGVTVHVFDEPATPEAPPTPDAVFPNNWFSTHADGRVVLYPMAAPNRRLERRADILAFLGRHYRLGRLLDLSPLERQGLYLEGTGALVLDHAQRVAYMGRSGRAHEVALRRFCALMRYRPHAFDTADAQGLPVYHSNVLMHVGTAYAAAGLALLPRGAERRRLRARLQSGGRQLIELGADQVRAFAGNALELATPGGAVLALSSTAADALDARQKMTFEGLGLRLLPLAVPTLERAGGSVRCMLAGVHLAPRSEQESQDAEVRSSAASIGPFSGWPALMGC